MIEIEIQKRFFEIARGALPQEPLPLGLKTYQELVYYRFEELLEGSFPAFRKLLKKDDFENLVKRFLADKPQSPLIWEAAEEFRKYINKKKLIELDFAKDLLWYESNQILCSLAPHEECKISHFSWIRRFRLAKSTKTKILKYRVHENEYETKGKYPILLYRSCIDYEIYYLEITEFMYKFLNLLESKAPKEALKVTCKKFDIDKSETKEMIQSTLDMFIQKGILVR